MAYVYFGTSLINHFKSFWKKKKKNVLVNRTTETLPDYEVVISAKNEELNIRDCLISVINQTYKPKRIHIIEDKSRDRTLDEILSTIKNIPKSICYENSEVTLGNLRFRLIKCTDKEIEYYVWSNIDRESLGKGRATNALVLEDHIKTPYFLSVDADTIIDSKFAERTLKIAKKDKNIAAIYGFLFIVPEKHTLLGKLYNHGFDISSRISHVIFRVGGNLLKFHYCLSGPRVLFSTKVYSKCPRPTDTKAGDTAHAWELQAEGYKILCILNTYGISRMPSDLEGIIKQRINWHSGPFQNLYIRGVKTLKKLKNQDLSKFLGGSFSIFYYTIFSPIYHIKWGIIFPIMALFNYLPQDLVIKYYLLDYSISLGFAIYSTMILKSYGYFKKENVFHFLKKFNLFYFFFRPIVAWTTIYCGLKTTTDIIKHKLFKKNLNWTGYT